MVTWRSVGAVGLLVGLLLLARPASADEQIGPWNLTQLKQTPSAEWGGEREGVREVYYAGEPYRGQPTRVFAYYAKPAGEGPFPAMVLVHGGGGKAFQDWARHWADRGYAAIAMDLAGNGPDGRLQDGGPNQSDQEKFRDFTNGKPTDMWTYHAVAAVIRGHSLLRSRPEVDAKRTGLTGISWGGYLTCIVAGVDDRFQVAVPVYGCGFLHENSAWKAPHFDKMSEEERAGWVKLFDPSQYLGRAKCPMLFLNGTNDFAYPLDSYQKSYNLVRQDRTLSIVPRLPHGHIWTFQVVDRFVDSVLRPDAPGAQPLPALSEMEVEGNTARAKVSGAAASAKAELHYTTDEGLWQKREWKSATAQVENGSIVAKLPAERPLVCYLSVTEENGVLVATPHVELGKGE
jgi:dienelactone hydrolase